MAKYTIYDFESAMEDMWELICSYATRDELLDLKNDHPILEELDEYGPGGPVGIGLGQIGGCGVGEGD